MRRYYPTLVILLTVIALLLRLAYVWTTDTQTLSHDERNYSEQAIRLIEQGVYSYLSDEPNARVTPGYPLVVAAIYKAVGYKPLDRALFAVRILQCILGAVAVILMYLLGHELFNKETGMLAAVLVAFYPTYIWSPWLLTTETLFLTVLLGLLYYQARILRTNQLRYHMAAGLLLAFAVLIRPNVLPLAVIPYVFLWFRDRRLYAREIMIGMLSFASLMLPWWIRNALTLHEFIFTAKGGAGNPFLAGTDPYFRGTIDWAEAQKGNQLKEGLHRLSKGLREDPLLWIRWFTIGKFRVFFKTPHLTLPSPFAAIFVWLHLIFAWVGWISLLTFRNRSVRFLCVSLLVFLGIHMMFIPVTRYTYGMYPFLMLGFASAVTGIWNRYWDTRTPFRKGYL
ncbi:MAG: glycosyltransferase family 39 protein [Gorillibacterium sp.]|nr:glycosyltransferase family 39 protein [Gorillibacterium sp.]